MDHATTTRSKAGEAWIIFHQRKSYMEANSSQAVRKLVLWWATNQLQAAAST